MLQAETMKIPSSAASIRYSGQCFLSEINMGIPRLLDSIERFPGLAPGFSRA